LIEEGFAVSETDWQSALESQAASREWIRELFAEVDVLVTPASVGPAPDVSTTGDPVMNSPWSFCGFPTVTFPMGLSDEGLPVGVQLIGKPDEERELLEAAIWCENLLASQHLNEPGE
jgi:aspartyl-tRNA(Asn)/glutamyl-tRNA(Gln) amidotransferase subunit A